MEKRAKALVVESLPKEAKRFDCPHEGCDASFRAETTLKLHYNNSHGSEDFEEFSSRINICMKARIQESIEDMEYEVDEFKSVQREEPEEPERFTCDECNSTFRCSIVNVF